MRLVSFGLINLNYYIQNGRLSLISGSRYSINVMANLASNHECIFYGVLGNDYLANILNDYINSLNIKLIKKVELFKTPIIFYKNNKNTTICPYCNRDRFIEYTFDDNINILDEDILVLDNLNDDTYKIIKNKKNKIFLLLTELGDILYKAYDELKEIFSLNYEMICITKNVYNSLSKKYLIDELELKSILNVKLLIIVDDNLNSILIYDDIVEEKALDDNVKVFDISGGIEAYFSEFINDYLNNNVIDEKHISRCYIKACSIASFIFKNYGALPHLKQISKIDNYENCICDIIRIHR